MNMLGPRMVDISVRHIPLVIFKIALSNADGLDRIRVADHPPMPCARVLEADTSGRDLLRAAGDPRRLQELLIPWWCRIRSVYDAEFFPWCTPGA